MTEEKFTELLNLYLDKEISAEDLKLLEVEIASNPDRKRAFVERCRLHKAMRMALKTERSRSRSSSSRRSSSSSGRRSNVRPSTRISEFDEFARAPSGSSVPRWLLLSGMAASVLLGLILLPPVFQNTTDSDAMPELVGVTSHELQQQDLLDSFGRSELRRFASIQQQRDSHYHASLVSQMRLMGLRPELTPKDKQLENVSLEAIYKPKERVSQAELFQRIQEMKAIPEPKLIRIEEVDTDGHSFWPSEVVPVRVSFEDI